MEGECPGMEGESPGWKASVRDGRRVPGMEGECPGWKARYVTATPLATLKIEHIINILTLALSNGEQFQLPKKEKNYCN